MVGPAERRDERRIVERVGGDVDGETTRPQGALEAGEDLLQAKVLPVLVDAPRLVLVAQHLGLPRDADPYPGEVVTREDAAAIDHLPGTVARHRELRVERETMDRVVGEY